jgi:hypothetical protein
MNTENTQTKVIFYKGIEIVVLREGNKIQKGCYIFYLDGIKQINTNILMAKRIITRTLNN